MNIIIDVIIWMLLQLSNLDNLQIFENISSKLIYKYLNNITIILQILKNIEKIKVFLYNKIEYV